MLGGIVKISLSYQDSFAAWLVLATLYSVLYMPTLSLTNSMAFAHLDKAKVTFPGSGLGNDWLDCCKLAVSDDLAAEQS